MNIKVEREAVGISQAELARRIGMHQPKLSRIENGHIEATAGELTLIEAALREPRVAEAAIEEWESEGGAHLSSYPAAPSGKARKAWFARRNQAMQTRGVPAPVSGTYGAAPKKPKV